MSGGSVNDLGLSQKDDDTFAFTESNPLIGLQGYVNTGASSNSILSIGVIKYDTSDQCYNKKEDVAEELNDIGDQIEDSLGIVDSGFSLFGLD